MVSKTKEKETAIGLRKNGQTYSEILKQVRVAKSTLGLWFKEVKLSRPQTQALTQKKLLAAKRGGEKVKSDRIKRVADIIKRSQNEIDAISERELWLIGIALYWAEGSKEKDFRPGSGLKFSNSDPEMAKIFIKWLVEVCDVSKDRIFPEIYIHESNKNRIPLVKEFWSEKTGFPVSKFEKVYFKRNKIKTVRKNVGDSYFGLLSVRVKSSSELQRKITGWIKGVVKCSL